MDNGKFVRMAGLIARIWKAIGEQEKGNQASMKAGLLSVLTKVMKEKTLTSFAIQVQKLLLTFQG